MPQFAPPDLPADRVRVIAPGIDPLLPKNAPMSLGEAQQIVGGLGIDLGRPLLAQISRLDPWKDPVGVIDAFGLVRGSHPGVQLALLGAMEAADDPEAGRIAGEVRAAANGDSDIHVLTDPDVIGPAEGAMQLLASVVLQKSLREGFGLTVSEALWKSTPVTARMRRRSAARLRSRSLPHHPPAVGRALALPRGDRPVGPGCIGRRVALTSGGRPLPSRDLPLTIYSGRAAAKADPRARMSPMSIQRRPGPV